MECLTPDRNFEPFLSFPPSFPTTCYREVKLDRTVRSELIYLLLVNITLAVFAYQQFFFGGWGGGVGGGGNINFHHPVKQVIYGH